jgi:hypothetical protein
MILLLENRKISQTFITHISLELHNMNIMNEYESTILKGLHIYEKNIVCSDIQLLSHPECVCNLPLNHPISSNIKWSTHYSHNLNSSSLLSYHFSRCQSFINRSCGYNSSRISQWRSKKNRRVNRLLPLLLNM